MADEYKFVSEKKRLSDKAHEPTEAFLQSYMGNDAWQRLMHLEDLLRERYVLNREVKFPFGNNYGWGFRYTHNKTLRFHVFFEEDGFCCTISIGGKGAMEIDPILHELKPKLQTMWKNRYPCGYHGDYYGGWIHYSVAHDDELPDMIRLISVKVKPKKQK
ncbi:MAG: DUF3788 family protein [Defluviitaleaceae bacterium]|nr:DUF3788 family protein [Defluviitaleaceae bacterium]